MKEYLVIIHGNDGFCRSILVGADNLADAVRFACEKLDGSTIECFVKCEAEEVRAEAD